MYQTNRKREKTLHYRLIQLVSLLSRSKTTMFVKFLIRWRRGFSHLLAMVLKTFNSKNRRIKGFQSKCNINKVLF